MRRMCGASPLPLMIPFDVLRSADKNTILRIDAGVKAGSACDSSLTVSQLGCVDGVVIVVTCIALNSPLINRFNLWLLPSS